MRELILHHYPLSFFAEKIRRILAYKKIPWRSVEQPMMMPKPELTALTGGYRRIPVLQIGADVYCDTACIARRIEALHPHPACFPEEQSGLARLIEDWADHRFTSQVVPSVIVDMMPSLPPGILDDRAAMSPMLSKQMLLHLAPHTLTQARQSLDRLDEQLREREFLLGDAFTIADAACFHPISFLKNSERLFAEVIERPALAAWYARIEGFGAGESRPMKPVEALAIAREARPTHDAALGESVSITADDYGQEEVRGAIAASTEDEVTLLRRDPDLGEIAIHFPRTGYRIVQATADS